MCILIHSSSVSNIFKSFFFSYCYYRTAHKSSKKLYEQNVKLEKLWSHIFTTIVPLTQRDTWYRKLREAIDREQNQAIWVSEAKVYYF